MLSEEKLSAVRKATIHIRLQTSTQDPQTKPQAQF